MLYDNTPPSLAPSTVTANTPPLPTHLVKIVVMSSTTTTTMSASSTRRRRDLAHASYTCTRSANNFNGRKPSTFVCMVAMLP